MPANKYTVHDIGKSTYAIEEKGMGAQVLYYLLVGEERALLIDTGFGLVGLDELVKNLTILPVTVACTHAHADHIGGNHFFEELWFHEADKAVFALHTNPAYTKGLLTEGLPAPLRALMGLAMKKMLDIDASGAYQYFGDNHVFRLGGRDVEVVPTPGHTPGSVCFLDRGSRMLFSGDSVCEWGVLLHFTRESCPPAVFLESMRHLKTLEPAFDTMWPGHHGFPVEKSYIDEYMECARQIVEGGASYGSTKGRRCAKYGRVLITVPHGVGANG